MRLALFFLSTILVCCKIEEKTALPNPEKPAQTQVSKYSFNEMEKNVLRTLLVEDLATSAEGGDGLSGSSVLIPLHVSAESLQMIYEGNEVLGDKRFRRKLLSVSGVVASIDRSVGENYFVSLQGGSSSFSKPRASMADGYTDYLAELKKGQKIILVCSGDGMLLGSPVLQKCLPLETWAEQMATEYLESFDEKLVRKDSTAAMLLVMTVAIAGRPEYLKGCFDGERATNSACISKASAHLDSATYEKAFAKIKMAGTDLKSAFSKQPG